MRPVYAAFVAALAVLLLHFGSLAQAEMRVFVVDEAAGTVRQYSGTGDDLGVFAAGLASPGWITADRAGNIYVVGNSGPGGCCQGWVGTINKFSPTGHLLLTIATPFTAAGVRVGSDGTIYTAAYGGGPDQPDRGIYRYSASGVALGLFALPSGLGGDFIAFDQSGNLYAPNNSSGAIVRISPTGADLGVFATLPGAEGIAFDPVGNVYVSSYSGTVIEKYSASGAGEGTFASIELSSIYGLAFDSHGNLYVANFPFGPWPPSSGTIRKFSPSGTDLGVFASTGLAAPRDLVIVERSEEVTAVGPASLWIGVRNSDDVGLRVDLRAELLLNASTVAAGSLPNVSSGSSGFGKAILNAVPLSLPGGFTILPDDTLSVRVSVRRTCSGGGHASGTVRLWYNGQPVDTGVARDAGSRFSVTVDGSVTNYFLRSGFDLETVAGSSRLFLDTTVDSKKPCPNRPFTEMGTWSIAFP